ncbi:hypothetical protein CPAR01_02621 [Colletotrichum paranaense]|uniref:Uncharacterized protein n=1 Tax=Colletotrichum paranaense TaxID=1914294 RepID=A0ABQ9T025_9PEZI|nr:uncharacterized protein CPAR01_02621 [Colletotrichum paranaense]KAK1545119.1 hypothetical protein CPAR01_02621 [Colletotrichum paranaense]
MPPKTTMDYDATRRQTESTYPYTASNNVCSAADNQYNGPVKMKINEGTIINHIRPVTNKTSYHITIVPNGQFSTGTSSPSNKRGTGNPVEEDISRGSSKTTPTSDGRRISLPNSVDPAKHARLPYWVACLRIRWISAIIRHSSLRAYGLICGFLMW